ncbi:regulator of RNA terminal phosphate cyclase [Chthoniobacter flavus Ellin428]|uniref:Regulator of RNA terminal phosphate cyclase n=1 Tax=Chthoniobacter flavus Ellin428 TaxID=497964 RepID=B4D8H3_9BACT|nr:RNA repair transcriptional activator RtcR [Chthoniobacter flavus]EDY17195.1 regulator of RNA terminal phosphate cyclase [Chthoniobacter flavus Ellin428]TCO86980.1 transcriptional regulatory protein RtcR [Chthoniobacter flavus]
MPAKKLVILGLLGTQLDRGVGPRRWEMWRPTVSLCQQEELLVDRLELLHDRKATSLGGTVAEDIAGVSPETEVRRHEVEFRDAWDFEEVYGALADFARSYPFQPEREDYLVHITTGTHVAQICLFLLAESRHIPARLIQTSPPDDRERGSPGRYAIIDLDLSRYDRIAARFAEEQREARTFLKSGIATRNPAFNRMIEEIEQVAVASREPILLMGPTGAGKSSLARRVFELKKQRHQLSGPFVEVNCATLRGDTATSTLFGHVRGSFTGAQRDRTGLLRLADGGLLFLDEIGELGADEQAMLLRALEEKRFLPVGADREVESDFQLIAGTNRGLLEAVRIGKFREDLLARINLWTFQLPGLAQRSEDIEPNLDHELESAGKRAGRRISMAKDVRAAFLKFARSPEARWSANFRDLNAAVTRMATLAPGGRITRAVLDAEIQRLLGGWSAPAPVDSDDALLNAVLGAEAAAKLDLFDRAQLACVLRVCRSSPTISDAGRRLFSVSREKRKVTNDADRLRKYLDRFDLTWSKATAHSRGGL